MRYITILGSKQHPVTKYKKEIILKKNKIISIIGVNKELKNGQLYLQIIGENLKLNLTYNWKISFDGKIIIPQSTGTTLILSKSNTNKYLNANKIFTIIRVGNYVSKNFEL